MPNASYRIFKADVGEHREVLADLQKQCFPDDHQWPLDGTHWWLAGYGKALVAFAGLHVTDYDGGGAATLCRSGVAEHRRGHGIQQRLLQVRELWARRNGIGRLITYVSTKNPASINSCIKRGFRAYEPPRGWGHEAFVYLEKKL